MFQCLVEHWLDMYPHRLLCGIWHVLCWMIIPFKSVTGWMSFLKSVCALHNRTWPLPLELGRIGHSIWRCIIEVGWAVVTSQLHHCALEQTYCTNGPWMDCKWLLIKFFIVFIYYYYYFFIRQIIILSIWWPVASTGDTGRVPFCNNMNKIQEGVFKIVEGRGSSE